MVTVQPIPHLILQTDSGNRFLSLVGSTCWTVGRGDDNNFVLPDRWISRNHAMLQRMETGEFYLIDLGSRNGSFVNGRRVSVPVTLQNGDHLTFGQTELQFYAPEADPLIDSSVGLDSQEFTATATLHVRRLISVLVVDIRNFTGMTRQLDEKLLSEVIGTWFRCAGDIIRDYGSWVDKYIGDSVMAVWIHGPQGIDAEEMIRITCALSALHKMSSQLHERYPLPFPVRIGAGLNTGYAMVGNTGTGDRPDYTALGDTVNAAFRLETATKQLGVDIAIGEATYRYLAESGISPTLLQEHAVSLKGYDIPTLTYAGSFADLDTFLKLVANK
ncbi:adenylate/guanylate cyclase domain-containing protein [Phormidium tenue FACHB-886]|nr:adenylate/guanylate cyclase domain-containing protein [Phormidium tenue FACHB-886]